MSIVIKFEQSFSRKFKIWIDENVISALPDPNRPRMANARPLNTGHLISILSIGLDIINVSSQITRKVWGQNTPTFFSSDHIQSIGLKI